MEAHQDPWPDASADLDNGLDLSGRSKTVCFVHPSDTPARLCTSVVCILAARAHPTAAATAHSKLWFVKLKPVRDASERHHFHAGLLGLDGDFAVRKKCNSDIHVLCRGMMESTRAAPHQIFGIIVFIQYVSAKKGTQKGTADNKKGVRAGDRPALLFSCIHGEQHWILHM